jgi:hypothetical protein
MHIYGCNNYTTTARGVQCATVNRKHVTVEPDGRVIGPGIEGYWFDEFSKAKRAARAYWSARLRMARTALQQLKLQRKSRLLAQCDSAAHAERNI